MLPSALPRPRPRPLSADDSTSKMRHPQTSPVRITHAIPQLVPLRARAHARAIHQLDLTGSPSRPAGGRLRPQLFCRLFLCCPTT